MCILDLVHTESEPTLLEYGLWGCYVMRLTRLMIHVISDIITDADYCVFAD